MLNKTVLLFAILFLVTYLKPYFDKDDNEEIFDDIIEVVKRKNDI